MEPFDQTNLDTFRLIILRRDGSEILLSPGDCGWSLPFVQARPRERIAPQLIAKLKEHLQMEVYCLFVPSFTTSYEGAPLRKYAVLESIWHNGQAPAGTCWIPRTAAACQRVHPVEDHNAIAESLREMDSYVNEAKTGAFGRPGWLREMFTWSQEQLSPWGFRPIGNFRQFNFSPTFSLIRFETNGPAVWFKATGKPNLHELPITTCLARLFPGNLPQILGIHPSWNAWLSEEISETTLDQCADLTRWENAADNLAELQIASIGKTCTVLDAGCRDLRLQGLVHLIPRFVDRMSELMAAQVKLSPPPLTVSELEFLGARLREALLFLQDLGLPDTLGHTDFNPGNIVVSPTRCVFLDWAEACVTNPFVTFEYLREHARRNLSEGATAMVRIANAYHRPWTTLLSSSDIGQALTVSPLIAVFIYAVASGPWTLPETLHDSARSRHLRSLTRRMHYEATLLTKGENSMTVNSPIPSQPAAFSPHSEEGGHLYALSHPKGIHKADSF